MDLNTPYAIILKNELTTFKNYNSADAENLIQNSTIDSIKEIANLEDVVLNIINSISKNIDLTSDEKKFLTTDVFNGYRHIHLVLTNILHDKLKDESINKVIFKILDDIHNYWVATNAYKFNLDNRQHQKFQHLPMPLIGYKEIIKDLFFLEPVISYYLININKKELKKEYATLTNKYLIKNKLLLDNRINIDKLSKLILKGNKFYPYLTKENTAKNLEEAQLMATQVAQKLETLSFNNIKTL